MTIKAVKGKVEVNRIVKQIHELFPEATKEETALTITLKIPSATVLSCLKCRGGWSILFNDGLIDLNEQYPYNQQTPSIGMNV